MSCQFIALDKLPRVRPIGIGKTRRHLFAESILLVAGDDAHQACGINQLYADLKAKIEGGIHAVIKFWTEHNADNMTGFLLINARNSFNE